MKILDATCGSRAIWFDKKKPDVFYCDIRQVKYNFDDGREIYIHPDVIHDYTEMPFKANYFDMVVFDPPHLTNVGLSSRLAKRYGKLFGDWKDNIAAGFSECFRVLKGGGILIFKWNERDISTKEVLLLTPVNPLFGQKAGSREKTHWITFVSPVVVERKIK